MLFVSIDPLQVGTGFVKKVGFKPGVKEREL